MLSSTWRYTGPYCSMQPEKRNDVLDIRFDLSTDRDHIRLISQRSNILELLSEMIPY